MIPRIGYYNNYPLSVSPLTNGSPYTRSVGNDFMNDSIFSSGLRDTGSIGDSFQSDGMNKSSKSKDDNTPIGEEELSSNDEKIIDAAMKEAGVPEDMEPIAVEHLAAMNKTGNTSGGKTNNNTNNTNSNEDKTNKLADFLEKYAEQFGTDGEISKGDYLKNVSSMMKQDMAEQGKPYIDPETGAFDPDSSEFYNTKGQTYKDMARASAAIGKGDAESAETSNKEGIR